MRKGENRENVGKGENKLSTTERPHIINIDYLR
jgi:hypothetical protein